MRAWAAACAGLMAAGVAAFAGGCGGSEGGDGAGGAPAATAAASESATTAPGTAPAGTAPAATAPARTAPRPAPQRPRPLPGLPGYTAGFAAWERLNASPIPPDSPDAQAVGFDAHRSTKNVYVNLPPARLGAVPPYPAGTILVKTGEEAGVVTLVAVMRKVRGLDPEHGDWQFIEWKRPDASTPFATDASLRDGTCWGCHASVAGDDWVFTAAAPR